MFNMNSESKLQGPGYIILNGLRVLNIIALLLVAIASWVMLVMTVKTNSFFFLDGASHFITSIVAMFLLLSELPLRYFKDYFADTWPVLSHQYGLTYLGTAMMALGFNTLGNLNKEATSVEHLGLALWREVIAAGILVTTFGAFNIIATFIFCDRHRQLTGRHVRSYGAAPPIDKLNGSSIRTGSSRRPVSPVLPMYNSAPPTEDNRKSRFNFRFPIRTSHISKPIVTDQEQFDSRYDERSSPVVPDIQRPATALHPAFNHVNEAPSYPRPPPPPASSRYSEASGITRF
jgi:hypothetical protein